MAFYWLFTLVCLSYVVLEVKGDYVLQQVYMGSSGTCSGVVSLSYATAIGCTEAPGGTWSMIQCIDEFSYWKQWYTDSECTQNMQYNHSETTRGCFNGGWFETCVVDSSTKPVIAGWGKKGQDYLQIRDYELGQVCGDPRPTVVSTYRAGCFIPSAGRSIHVVCQNDQDALEYVYTNSENCTGTYVTSQKPGQCVKTSVGWADQSCKTFGSALEAP